MREVYPLLNGRSTKLVWTMKEILNAIKKHTPEEIIGKPLEAEIVTAQGGTVAEACRRIGVTEQTYYPGARSMAI